MATVERVVRRPAASLLAVLALIAVAGGACRTTAPSRSGVDRPTAVQALLRVVAELDGERESFRAIVRRWEDGALELRVNDPLGRSAWRLEVSGAGGRWSGRDGTVCRIGQRLAAPVFGVSWPLRAADLGRWLLGDPPRAGIPVGAPGMADDSGRWTFVWDGRRLEAWSLTDAAGRTIEGSRRGDRSTLRYPAARLELEWTESRRERLGSLPPPDLAHLDDLPECPDAGTP